MTRVLDQGSERVRVIALYLPQFHPIPENDEWWGTGFTEWTNVASARPLFPGHYQPHVPADLGFYDLRLPEARQAQADLAREYGVYGFCYYHYWFDGRRLLGRPFDEVLASGQPELPFCLCWANENWSRRWDGGDDQILIGQEYSEDDDRGHIGWLLRAFRDPRYIRVGGKPLFLVYRVNRLPDPLKTTWIWRAEARQAGVGELFLCRVESFPDERGDPRAIGFDAAVEFQPDWTNLHAPLYRRSNNVYDYASVVERMLRKEAPPYRRFSCVMPSWDNSPRRKRVATIFRGSTPALYERWLGTVVGRAAQAEPDERIVFVNAWNEWAEGNHLEPCRKWGRAYLDATRRARAAAGGSSSGGQAATDVRGLEAATYRALTAVVRSDAAAAVRHVQGELAIATEDLTAAPVELERLERLRLATHELAAVIPSGASFILVDQEEWGSGQAVAGRWRIPFLERDGQYWGPPADDETAIREFERLRRCGASFMVFAWPAFWWLEHYAGLAQYLRSAFPCVLANERLVVFDLRARVERPAQTVARAVLGGRE